MNENCSLYLSGFSPAAATTTTGRWVGSGTIGAAATHSSQFSKLLLTWKIYNDVTEEEEKTEQSAKPTTGGNNEQTKLTNQPTSQHVACRLTIYIAPFIHPWPMAAWHIIQEKWEQQKAPQEVGGKHESRQTQTAKRLSTHEMMELHELLAVNRLYKNSFIKVAFEVSTTIPPSLRPTHRLPIFTYM